MSSVPISKAYVEKLKKAADASKQKDSGLQSKDKGHTKVAPSFHGVFCKHKISRTCHDQAVRICVEKDDST